MKAIVVTSCSNRKKHKPSEQLRARHLPRGTIEQVTQSWFDRVQGADTRHLPRALYCGRGYREAEKAANRFGADPFIISAGLGLLRPIDQVPAYDLTLSRKSNDCILKPIVKPIQLSEWWTAIGAHRGEKNRLSSLLLDNVGTIVLLACSSDYLSLVIEDLGKLPTEERQRVRIFGPQNAQQKFTTVAAMVMPYDERFDGPDGPLRGTKADFAQRCLSHYVTNIWPVHQGNVTLEEDKVLLEMLAEGWRSPTLIVRETKDDEEIINLVPNLWNRANGKSGRMLRILRDEENIACEQGRFAQLFKVAKQEYSL